MGDQRAERTPRPGRGTPVADISFSLGRAYSDYCALVATGNLSAEDKAAEKGNLQRRAKALMAAVEAL